MSAAFIWCWETIHLWVCLLDLVLGDDSSLSAPHSLCVGKWFIAECPGILLIFEVTRSLGTGSNLSSDTEITSGSKNLHNYTMQPSAFQCLDIVHQKYILRGWKLWKSYCHGVQQFMSEWQWWQYSCQFKLCQIFCTHDLCIIVTKAMLLKCGQERKLSWTCRSTSLQSEQEAWSYFAILVFS